MSDEAKTDQVFVQGYSGPGKWQISVAGGTQPRWRRDGNELFYVAPDKTVMAVSVKTTTGLEYGSPRPLVQTNPRSGDPRLFAYAVTADGQRFLVQTPHRRTH